MNRGVLGEVASRIRTAVVGIPRQSDCFEAIGVVPCITRTTFWAVERDVGPMLMRRRHVAPAGRTFYSAGQCVL